MAVEKKVGITFEAQDKTGSAFERVQARLKQIRREERESGEAIFKRTVAGGAGSIIDAGADLLGVGAAVFAIDMIGRALNATVDKVREIRKEMRETGASAGEVADKLLGTVPVYGQIWQAGRKIREELDGTAAAIDENAKEMALMERHFNNQVAIANLMKESLANSLKLAKQLTREAMLLAATPTDRVKLQAQFQAEDQKVDVQTRLEKDLAELKKDREEEFKTNPRVREVSSRLEFLDRNLVNPDFSETTKEKWRKEYTELATELAGIKKGINDKFNTREEELKKRASDDAGKIESAESLKRADAARKLEEKRAALVAEAAERAARTSYESRQRMLRSTGQEVIADMEASEEEKRRAMLEVQNRTDRALREAELTRDDVDSTDPNKQRAAQDLLNIEAREKMDLMRQGLYSQDAIAKAATERQRQQAEQYLNDREEAQREMLELDRQEQAALSELRARGLEADGKHLDAKLERIRQHYAERIAEAKTAAEREALAKLQAAEEAEAKGKDETSKPAAIAVSEIGKQVIQSALLGRELSGLRDRFESDNPDRNLYLRTAVAAEATARAGEATAKAVVALAAKDFGIKGRKV